VAVCERRTNHLTEPRQLRPIKQQDNPPGATLAQRTRRNCSVIQAAFERLAAVEAAQPDQAAHVKPAGAIADLW
jgi:hypothetical protein